MATCGHFGHMFIPYYALPHIKTINIHIKFQKIPSMFAESKENINVHSFNAQTAFGHIQ
jgi:hypothetical protein